MSRTRRSRPTTVLVALALGVLAAACGGSDALAVEDAWARSTPNGLGAVYATITSPVDDVLVAARIDTSIAGSAEIHEVTGMGGMMSMQELEGGLPLPAGEPVVLEPGGYHVMLLDMPAVLAPGSTVDVTFVLASGAETTVAVEVRETADDAMDGGMHGGADG